ncbi:MAG: hypothetical protein ABJA90_10760, partial [Ginsengibacter sp.]
WQILYLCYTKTVVRRKRKSLLLDVAATVGVPLLHFLSHETCNAPVSPPGQQDHVPKTYYPQSCFNIQKSFVPSRYNFV